MGMLAAACTGLRHVLAGCLCETIPLSSCQQCNGPLKGPFFRQIRREGSGNSLRQIKGQYRRKSGGQTKAAESPRCDYFLASR